MMKLIIAYSNSIKKTAMQIPTVAIFAIVACDAIPISNPYKRKKP